VPEVVALAGALADAGEHRETAVLLGDVVDELHDEHGLADAGAAEQADLAAAGVRGEQVDDLDAGLEHLTLVDCSDELGRGRWIGLDTRLGVDRAELVDGLPTTFRMRPSVSRPTGTVIGAPVFLTGCRDGGRRWCPSRWQRTVFSPRCCATSSTRLSGWSLIDGVRDRGERRVDLGEAPSGNSTSTTGPITCRIQLS
jgi:hypothetical protein